MKKVFFEFFQHSTNMIFALLTLCLVAASFYLSPTKFLSSLWILIIPIIIAPFFEWVVHRYVLHRIVDSKRDPRGYAYMLKLHYKHHWEPSNIPFVFAPASGPIIIFLVFLPVGILLFSSLSMALLFEAGIIGYFLFYEWIHLAHHMPSYRPLTSFGKHIRNAHTWHHYKNENFWWGVTNPLGDYVLGTFKDPKEVEFSPTAKALGDLQKSHHS